jgi:hypothetical protein
MMLSQVMVTTGDYGEAEELAREAWRLSSSFGDEIGVAQANLALARAEAGAGEYGLAYEHCQQAVVVGRQSGHLEVLMGSLTELGRIELALGHPADARRFFDETLLSFARLQMPHSNLVAGARLGLGWAAQVDGDPSAAKSSFLHALNSAGRTAWETMDALAGLAEVYVAEGCTERAVEVFSITMASPATAHATRVRLTREMDAAGVSEAPALSADLCPEELQRVSDALIARLLAEEGITAESPAGRSADVSSHERAEPTT